MNNLNPYRPVCANSHIDVFNDLSYESFINIYKCKLNGEFYIVVEKYDDTYVRAINIKDKYSYTIPIKDLELWLTEDELKRSNKK